MGTVTLKVRTLLTGAAGALLLALALATAYLLGGAAQGTASPAQAASEPATTATDRTIQVVGKGSATVVPDRLAFTVTVTAKRDTLDDALSAASASMDRVLGVLGKQGVAKSDTQTTGLSMNPEYYYPSGAPRVLTGYRVTQRLRVQVPELAKGGAAVSAVVGSGEGVKVSNLSLVVGDPEQGIAEAREAAVEEAKAKAQQYADATGATLGEVVSVREVSAPASRPQPVSLRAAAKAAYDAVPIRAGESDLTVRVQVVWGLQ
ncbi:SIMPL domain-containing protein [Nocardioides sp.]|uniref:SIMPL domain-containing protein n=1 Tax=Nocardioides sp. TaxID=35761 RepID=UPI003526E985